MDDTIDAGCRLLHRRRVANVGREDFLALLGGVKRRNIEQTNKRIGAAQALAQGFADLAGRAGDENRVMPAAPTPSAYYQSGVHRRGYRRPAMAEDDAASRRSTRSDARRAAPRPFRRGRGARDRAPPETRSRKSGFRRPFGPGVDRLDHAGIAAQAEQRLVKMQDWCKTQLACRLSRPPHCASSAAHRAWRCRRSNGEGKYARGHDLQLLPHCVDLRHLLGGQSRTIAPRLGMRWINPFFSSSNRAKRTSPRWVLKRSHRSCSTGAHAGGADPRRCPLPAAPR